MSERKVPEIDSQNSTEMTQVDEYDWLAGAMNLVKSESPLHINNFSQVVQTEYPTISITNKR